MAEIVPTIEDGVKIYNVKASKGVTIADFEELYTNKINALIDLKKQELGVDKLKPEQISALRKDRRLGLWFLEGKPVNVTSLNQAVKANRKVKFTIPKPRPNLDRNFLEAWPRNDEVPLSANSSFRKRVKNLNKIQNLQEQLGNNEITERVFNNRMKKIIGASYDPKKIYGFGPGQSMKGMKKYMRDAYSNIRRLNQAFEAKHGFPFDVGHMWQSVGNPGERGIIDAFFGSRVEGKFTPENVAPQPRKLALEQLDHPFWSQINPNVPHKQQDTLKDLKNIYSGGEGWSGALDDYLMSGDTNYFKLSDIDPKLRSYITFGKKGTLEQRLAQVEQFQRDFGGASTGTQKGFFELLDKDGVYNPKSIEALTEQATDVAKKGDIVGIFKQGSKTAQMLSKTPARFALPAAGIALSTLNVGVKAEELEQNPTLINKARYRLSQAELALEGTELATAGAASPVTTPLQLLLFTADASLGYAQNPDETSAMSMLGPIPGTKAYEKMFKPDTPTYIKATAQMKLF